MLGHENETDGRIKKLACRHCGSLRLIFKERIACPKCEQVILGDRLRAIEETHRQLQEASRAMTKLLLHSDRNHVLHFAMNSREDAAAGLLSDPGNFELARTWVAASYLLVQADACKSFEDEAVSPPELLFASEEVICLDDRLEALRRNCLDVLDDGAFVWTENERLRAVPSSVVNGITAEIGEGWTALDSLEKIFGHDLVYPIRELIASEALSRSLPAVFHRRLAPDLSNASKATVFSRVCASLAAFIGFTIGPAFRSNNGILPVRDQSLEFMKQLLEKEFDKEQIAWFFSLASKVKGSKLEGLGYSTLVRDSSAQLTYLPYHSLFMLSVRTYKYTTSTNIGSAANYKGRAIEDVLFNGATACLQTTHPRNSRKLLRYQLPDGKGDLDVAGFDKSNLLLIEAKFWDSPTIDSLEEELDKFMQRIEYVRQNLSKLGFEPGLKITPVFFTPYAPFPKWQEIILLPSISSIISFIFTKFGSRTFELIAGDERIRQFVQTDRKERLMALDGSMVSSDIPENLYRIQDGVVDLLEDSEITVYAMTLAARAYPIFCEVSESVARQLRSSGVGPGTVIRMGLYNVLGGWAPTQLCFFTVLKSFEETKGQSAEVILTVANASSAKEDFVLRTWGDQAGRQILDFVKKWNVDFPKLLTRLDQKGQNYLSGVGIALGLQDMFDHVEQCSCGEVFGLSKALAVQLRTLYRDEKLRCPGCDPEFSTKIRKLTGNVGTLLGIGDLMTKLASRNEAASVK